MILSKEESYYTHKTSCPDCGSSDARAMYSNGSSYCFSCQTFTKSPTDDAEPVETGLDVSKFVFGGYVPKRGLTVDTMKRYGYQINNMMSETDVHIAPYYNEDKQLCAQHLRYEGDKSKMPFKGTNPKTMLMFGQQLFPAGGKRLVICEGEIDAMSTYQAMGSSWPVVGIPGADRTKKCITANLPFIESFEEVVLFFDNDEAGKQATKTALELLSFGKAKIVAEYPQDCKDANDILIKHGPKTLRETVFYKAEEYRPEGVVTMKDVRFNPESFSVSLYPWECFNKKLYARRGGELTVYTAGSGIGKSTILRAIYADLIKQGEKCAGIFLEETIAETKADIMSSILGKPIRKILAQIAVNNALTDKGLEPLFPDVEELDTKLLSQAEDQVDESGMLLIDHSKGYNLESVLSQIRYLAVSKGVKHILLDHISLLISSDREIDNEVKATDVVMKEFRILAEELGINIDIISHVRKRGNGQKSVNSGAQIHVEELRGSGSLFQVANNVVSFERHQQDDDPNLTVCRSLKNRLAGFTGVIGQLRFDPETGSLTEEHYEGESGFTNQEATNY